MTRAELRGYPGDRKIALALIDQAWMPPEELFKGLDPITADFIYIRWLGDRKTIERVTKVWGKTLYDVEPRLRQWSEVSCKAVKRKIQVLAFANTIAITSEAVRGTSQPRIDAGILVQTKRSLRLIAMPGFKP